MPETLSYSVGIVQLLAQLQQVRKLIGMCCGRAAMCVLTRATHRVDDPILFISCLFVHFFLSHTCMFDTPTCMSLSR